jgi:hypothetical protein
MAFPWGDSVAKRNWACGDAILALISRLSARISTGTVFRKRVGMEERKTINPAEVAWDELRAVMERDGWEVLQIVIVHKGQRIIAELNPEALSDSVELEAILDASVCFADQVKRKTRIQ